MTTTRTPSAWLLMAVGDERQHGGNGGYDDQVDLYYSWDSTVPNSGSVMPGDFVAFWDKRKLLGVSVVETVTSHESEKSRFTCPNSGCGKASFKERKTKSPRYRCNECGCTFATPVSRVSQVITYRSLHDAAWSDLEGLLSGPELRELCLAPKSQLAMRLLDWEAFSAQVITRGGRRAIERVMGRSPDLVFAPSAGIELKIRGGHRSALVRVRRGQGQFRERLIKDHGGQCAFTGAAPNRVLEAGHLYSYGRLGEHHEHGGLLLRRDIHRLFDDGGLAVDTSSLKIDVAPDLEAYPQYARLHDQPLRIALRDEQALWLAKHWEEHRSTANRSGQPTIS